MAKNLVIVESPAKARTIGRFLGRGYTVKASLGHVRDLPQGTLGVAVDEDFRPKYVVPKPKQALVKELKGALKDATTVYLATDPDREGEAIAWHLTQAADMGQRAVRRVVFHEITEQAIKEAFRHPREIDLHLVDAQQARRILDRLVGYKLSPLLWKKVRGGLSAGRVQSAALHMLVGREREIEGFVPQEYWRIQAELAKRPSGRNGKPGPFMATLAALQGSAEKLEVSSGQEAEGILQELDGAAYSVAKVVKRETQRRPTPPFTTSTLQQEAWRKLRFSALRTMRIAQQLYEGLPIGPEGTEGLITYMRTDSPVVSGAAVQEARAFIKERYGSDYLPSSPRAYTARAKGAQEAHEAVRPTSVGREPGVLKQYLSPEQLRLYDLIWKRMVASQMANALFDSTSVEIQAECRAGKRYLFRVSGSVQKFPGFLALYSEGTDEDEEEAGALPELAKGEALDCLGLDSQQRFTQPPPRYNEASLVKALEENGIGRPSTYAPTISTIQERGYVKKAGGALQPQPLGMIIDDLLRESFPGIIDAGFTAQMEEELDEIARGEKAWVPVLRAFYTPFQEAVAEATVRMPKVDEPTGETCDLCAKPMVIKKGRFGLFLACSGYPECRNTRSHQVKVGVTCPVCGGELVEKKSRKNKTFFGCGSYPKCTFATNLRPIPEPCPNCGGLLTAFPRGGVTCTKCEYKGRRPRPKPQEEPEPVAVGR